MVGVEGPLKIYGIHRDSAPPTNKCVHNYGMSQYYLSRSFYFFGDPSVTLPLKPLLVSITNVDGQASSCIGWYIRYVYRIRHSLLFYIF